MLCKECEVLGEGSYELRVFEDFKCDTKCQRRKLKVFTERYPAHAKALRIRDEMLDPLVRPAWSCSRNLLKNLKDRYSKYKPFSAVCIGEQFSFNEKDYVKTKSHKALASVPHGCDMMGCPQYKTIEKEANCLNLGSFEFGSFKGDTLVEVK